MENLALDKHEEHVLDSEIYMTLVQTSGAVASVSLERPDNIRIFSDEEYLNGVEASHGRFLDFELDQGFVIQGVARIVCVRIGSGVAGFVVHEFADSRRCGCYH